MKAKLLKQLRKRFAWKYEAEGIKDAWTVYDKKLNQEVYVFMPGLKTVHDMALLYMLRKIGLSDMFRDKAFRSEQRRKMRRDRQLRIKWNNL